MDFFIKQNADMQREKCRLAVYFYKQTMEKCIQCNTGFLSRSLRYTGFSNSETFVLYCHLQKELDTGTQELLTMKSVSWGFRGVGPLCLSTPSTVFIQN